MKSDLNHKQKAFVRNYLETGDSSKSAIKAGYSKKTAHVHASKLLKNGKIALELQKYQQKAAKSTGLTLEHMIEEIKDCKLKAEEAKNFSVVATCNQQLAKISGLLIDKQLTATTTPEDLRLELSKHFKVEVI